MCGQCYVELTIYIYGSVQIRVALRAIFQLHCSPFLSSGTCSEHFEVLLPNFFLKNSKIWKSYVILKFRVCFFSSKSYKNIKTYLLYEWNKLCSYSCCCCYYIYYYNILLIFFNNPTLKFLTFLVSALEWAKHWGWKVTREPVFNRKVLIKCYCFRQEKNHFRNFALSIRALQSPKYRFQSFITFP